jgi:hypothetical protein
VVVFFFIQLANMQLSAIELSKVKTHVNDLVAAFINHVNEASDLNEKRQLVQDVIDSNNMLGKILNTPEQTWFFNLATNFYQGKTVTSSIAKIISAFPELFNAQQPGYPMAYF